MTQTIPTMMTNDRPMIFVQRKIRPDVAENSGPLPTIELNLPGKELAPIEFLQLMRQPRSSKTKIDSFSYFNKAKRIKP